MATKINKKILLESLKNKWIQHNNTDEKVWLENYPYYFKDLESNLICNMSDKVKAAYANGSDSEFKWTKRNGKDLPPKMQAIHSSSAMTFNIFDNDNVKIFTEKVLGATGGKYNIEYEKKFTTINSAQANVDICFTSKSGEEIIMLEMKMTEWLLNNPRKIPEVYLKADNELIGFTKKFIDETKPYKDKKGKVHYPANTVYFDVIQVILHIWGIFNSVKNGNFRDVKKIVLVCGMWTIESGDFFCKDSENQYKQYNNIYNEMEKEFEEFYNNLEPIRKLFRKMGIEEFDVKKMSVKSIIECLGKTNEPYLKRYI